MPIDIKLEQHDVLRVNGITQLIGGTAEKIQSLTNRLSTRQGEYFLDAEYGLDFESVLSVTQKEPDETEKEVAVRECILQDANVTVVNDVSVTGTKDRNTSIIFTAELNATETIVGGVEIG